MAKMQTCSGYFDLERPDPDHVNMVDIATQLSRICRYNGVCKWSVADHSVLCTYMLPVWSSWEMRMHVLLHDAHEAYTGDIISPVKRSLPAAAAKALRDMENRIQKAIYQHLGLPMPNAEELEMIKTVDRYALAWERFQKMPNYNDSVTEHIEWGLDAETMDRVIASHDAYRIEPFMDVFVFLQQKLDTQER